MMTQQIQNIWSIETGITELQANWASINTSEIDSIRLIWTEQKERLRGTRQLQEFSEKLSREWAIETGIIENLYDIERGVTITLIERGFHTEFLSHGSTNKHKDYVIRLLKDQKDALDGIFDFVSQRRNLSTSYIKELHAALVRSQHETEAVDQFGNIIKTPLIGGDWKTQPNFPERDGVIYTYCPPEHVASEMDRLVYLYNEYTKNNVDASVRSAWLHHRFTQIHPFQDGNGRVARALASLVLVQEGLFPLVVTRDEKIEYIYALEMADKGDLANLINLIARLQRSQFRKATAISETMLSTHADVKNVLGGLLKAADAHASSRRQSLEQVFKYSRKLEDSVAQRFSSITNDIRIALQRIVQSASVSVYAHDDQTSHYFRSQIIETAKYLGYYANTREYRAWISLNMTWNRRAKIVFSFHGIGHTFSGSLVCAPFLEFIDEDGEDDNGNKRNTITPIADEAFVFFYNENENNIIARFENWRERVLTVALQELSQNL